jgi:hypothetical protein
VASPPGAPPPPLVDRPGGTSSGEQPAAGAGQGRGNRVLVAAIGAGALVALVVVVALVVAGGGGGEKETTTTTEVGYNDRLEESFLSRCDGNGASRSVCQCAYDKFEATVPFRRFVEIDNEIERNPDARPKELVDILDQCVTTTT